MIVTGVQTCALPILPHLGTHPAELSVGRVTVEILHIPKHAALDRIESLHADSAVALRGNGAFAYRCMLAEQRIAQAEASAAADVRAAAADLAATAAEQLLKSSLKKADLNKRLDADIRAVDSQFK